MLRRSLLYILPFSFVLNIGVSQESYIHYQPKEDLEKARDYFDQNLYGQARISAQTYLADVLTAESNSSYNRDHITAENIYHISGLILELPQAETTIKDHIKQNIGNPNILNPTFALADFYYNNKQYDDAIYYFEMIDIDLLTEIRMSEMVFKKGYCHFVKKEFERAQLEFSYSKNIKNKYFYPINYYNGMCEYFTGDYDDAVLSFQRVESSSVYSKHIPYYISQIYFSQKQYDKLITYGERVLQEWNTKKKVEIGQLLGQTYFLRNDYDRALPHLERYEAETAELTVEEFYQLAFTQYKLGKYNKAIENFLEINREDSELGQLVNYYLADSYINTGDQNSARAAFKKVSEMDYSPSMRAEARFNYGKLSSQLGFEREAINILIDIKQSSPFYGETQTIINDILVNSSDYENALTIMESLPSLTGKLQATYQDIAFKKGLQLLSEGEPVAAERLFDKSDTYPLDPTINTQVSYWRGYIDMSDGDHAASLAHYDKYFLHEKKASTLPEESSKFMANYNQGYNHLKLEEYYFAVDQFQFAIDDILATENSIINPAVIDRVLPDAYVRAGDCLFKERKYNQAQKYYDGAIDSKKGDYIYALYQRALIEGLVQNNYQKIVTLEEIIDNYPDSEYADDAILQLGETYLSTGNPLPAADVFNKLVSSYKGKSNLINRAYLKLGLIAYNEGDPYKAISFYKNVFENNPNPQESQEAMLAIEEIYIDDLAKGEEFIKFVDSLPGYEIDAFAKDSLNFKAGENKFNNAEYTEAITALNNYLRKYPRGYYRLNAHYLRGESHALNKSYTSALQDYEAIINEGVSDYYERSLNKAAVISYNSTQDFAKALNYYSALERSTTNEEDKFQAQLGAMRSAFRIGRDSDVIAYSTKVNSNNLSSTSEKSAASYYLGKTLYKQGSFEEALSSFQNVSALSTNNQAAESRYLIAKIYYDQKMIAEAESQIVTANDKNRSYPFWIAKSLLLQSDIFVGRADLLNARAAVEAVLENFKDDPDLIAEANKKMADIKKKEVESNRIRTENPDGTLQLDTTGN